MLLEPPGKLPKAAVNCSRAVIGRIAGGGRGRLSPALPQQLGGKRQAAAHGAGGLAGQRGRGDSGDRQ